MSSGHVALEGPSRALGERSEVLSPDRRGVDGASQDCGLLIVRCDINTQDWSELRLDRAPISALRPVSALKEKQRKEDIPNVVEVECGSGHQVSFVHKAWRTIHSGQIRADDDGHKPTAIS
jgi:hypothetical protein